MGWSYRRSRKIAPGIRVNFSKRGLGLSVGPHHAKISISPTGRRRLSVGLPGTGLRYTDSLSSGNTSKRRKYSSASDLHSTQAPGDTQPVDSSNLQKPLSAVGDSQRRLVPRFLIVIFLLLSLLITVGVVSALLSPAAPGDGPRWMLWTSLLIVLFFTTILFSSLKRGSSNRRYIK